MPDISILITNYYYIPYIYKEYSSNLPDDRKIVKLMVVNLIVIFS